MISIFDFEFMHQEIQHKKHFVDRDFTIFDKIRNIVTIFQKITHLCKYFSIKNQQFIVFQFEFFVDENVDNRFYFFECSINHIVS